MGLKEQYSAWVSNFGVPCVLPKGLADGKALLAIAASTGHSNAPIASGDIASNIQACLDFFEREYDVPDLVEPDDIMIFCDLK